MKLLLTTWLQTLLKSIVISVPLGLIILYVFTYFEFAIGDPLGWEDIEIGAVFIAAGFGVLTFLSVSVWQGLKARKRLLETNQVSIRQADYLFLFTLATSVLLTLPFSFLFFLAFEASSILLYYLFAPIDFLLERFRP